MHPTPTTAARQGGGQPVPPEDLGPPDNPDDVLGWVGAYLAAEATGRTRLALQAQRELFRLGLWVARRDERRPLMDRRARA